MRVSFPYTRTLTLHEYKERNTCMVQVVFFLCVFFFLRNRLEQIFNSSHKVISVFRFSILFNSYTHTHYWQNHKYLNVNHKTAHEKHTIYRWKHFFFPFLNKLMCVSQIEITRLICNLVLEFLFAFNFWYSKN